MEATSIPTTGTTTTAAPAPVAAPVAPSTPAERPTFAQAFASDAAPSEPTAPPEAPTTQAADAATTAAPVHPNVPGEPPQEKWPQILENARTKAIADYKDKVGWAEGIDRAAYEETVRIGQLYQRDKPAYIRQILAEASAIPELAPLVRSEAARVLGTRTPQPQSSVPDIPIVNEQGQVVGNLREIVSQHLAEFAAKELEPIKRDYATRQQAEQERQQKAELDTAVTTLYQQAIAELPHFAEHEEEIAKVMNTLPKNQEPGTVLHRAWAQVVLPKLTAATQAKALDDLKTKAAASTANPASATVATTKRPTSFNDPALRWS